MYKAQDPRVKYIRTTKQSNLSKDDSALCFIDDILHNASRRDGSSPFLGGSTTTTSEPLTQDRGSCSIIKRGK